MAVLAALSGCNGGGSFNAAAPTGTFKSAVETPIGNGKGNGFVTLKNGIPTSLGFTLTPGALTNLPAGAGPAVFIVPLPVEASTFTPFRIIAIAYFGASTPPGLGNVPAHFSPLILINDPQAADAPDFAKELAPVAANEVAQDHVFINQFVPGLGAEYDDPAQPQRQPNWNSTGQNYFYYNGHMNGYGLGVTVPFLEQKKTRTDVIKQPNLYPKPGYYAHRHTVHFDASRNLYVIEISDFRYEGADKSIS